MPTARIPFDASLDFENTRSGDGAGSWSKNVVYDRYPNGNTYATQRPGISLVIEASDFTLPAVGRGAYYWGKAGAFYLVNNDDVSQGYGIPVGTISTGRDRVYFGEINDQLVIIDAENNEGWYINLSAPTTLIAITDLDFPPNQSPALQLAGGVATLDNFLYVLDSNGTLWNSDFGDASAWNALNFINAEREADAGLFITKHHDQIVVIGTKTIEFFYNAGNATGSPLSRRQDVSYRTGCIGRKSTYSTADKIVFIGIEQGGTIGLYEISNFQLSKKSSSSFDALLSNLGLRREKDFIVSLGMINDHYLVFISAVLPGVDENDNLVWNTDNTYVFDLSTDMVTEFELGIKDVSGFPVVDFADKLVDSDRTVTFQFLNGDIAEISAIMEPQDSIGGKGYFEDPDYIINQQDYILTLAGDLSGNIEMIIRTKEEDFDGMAYKFGHYLWVVGHSVSGRINGEPLQVRWSDDHYLTYIPYRDLDISTNRKMTRLGKFRRRAHEVRYDGPDQLRLEAIELNFGASKYA